MLEVGYTRIVSYKLWYYYTYLVIGLALLGIGSGHSAVQDQALLRALLGVPEDRFGVALMPLGYPRERPLLPINDPKRRPVDEVVHRGRW